MAEHLKRGAEGEAKALEFLKKEGFKILAQNWRAKHLEIDIIAEKKKMLHFVEVKTRKANSLVSARDSLSHKKKQNLEKLVAHWFLENPKSKQNAQLDFIAITILDNGEYSLEYIPNYTE